MADNILYKSASYVWRNTLLKWYRGHKKKQEERYWEEHLKRCGPENKDKTFYVIRRRDLYCGLFSLFLTNLQRIDDAVKMGYIPVVDMQNYFNIYLAEDKIGKENSWEYFFEQPMGYGLQDIARSRNVIIGSGAVPQMFPYLKMDFLTGKSGELAYWRKLTKKYIRLSAEAQKVVQAEYDRLFGEGDVVLGVLCRGTDYTASKPKNHPAQPSPQEAVEQAVRMYHEYGCNKVFLATEDGTYYKLFQETFGEHLITNRTEYAEYQGGSIGKETYERENDSYWTGMQYLITIELLSRCRYLCAGCTSGTVGALLLTEGYEDIYLFDLGIY